MVLDSKEEKAPKIPEASSVAEPKASGVTELAPSEEESLSATTEVRVEPAEAAIAESSIEGQVACLEGPVANALVSIGMNSTFTSPEGKFALEHIPPGIMKLRVKPPVIRYYNHEQEVLLEAGKKKEGVFIFLNEVTGTIQGNVTDENGMTLADVEVSGFFRLAKPATIVKTDEKGFFVVPDVPAGAYYVRAKASGHMIEGITVNVTGGSTALISFVLRRATLLISGTVTSARDHSPLDSDIYLMKNGKIVTRASTTNSAGGKFSFENLAPDFYEMTVLSPGHPSTGWREKLEQSLVVNLELN